MKNKYSNIMADFIEEKSIETCPEPKKKEKQSSVNHNLKKRVPSRLPRRKIDVYVNTKTPLKAIFINCEKLLEKEPEIVVHGLGAAVASAINLSLQLQQRFCDTLQVSVHTSSVELVDDLQPETDSTEVETQTRLNSAVHIRLWHTKKQV